MCTEKAARDAHLAVRVVCVIRLWQLREVCVFNLNADDARHPRNKLFLHFDG
jgi:hypothetical protein